MNKKWDSMCPGPGLWKEVKRVMKRGAKGGVFTGTRTLDIMMASLRMAGFEILDVFSWTYGQGFPKSFNVFKKLVKEVEKRYGEKRCKCVGEDYRYDEDLYDPEGSLDFERNHDRKLILDDYEDNDLVTRVCSWCSLPDQAYIDSLEGLGTALKPAWEPIIRVRKPKEPIEVDIEELLRSYGFNDTEVQKILTPSEVAE
jgi:hypothetical protein